MSRDAVNFFHEERGARRNATTLSWFFRKLFSAGLRGRGQNREKEREGEMVANDS